MKTHTRQSDEELLISTILHLYDCSDDRPDLTEACERLQSCIDSGLQDYSLQGETHK